jgi:hypothetical protein
MNRPQRERKPVERLPARPQNQPRQPRNPQAQNKKPPAAPVAPRRELDLTLKRVEAVKYDTKDPNSEFYTKFFTAPNDSITQRLQSIDYSNSKDKVQTLQLITNFELQNIDAIELKDISFASFRGGAYHNCKTNSDPKYSQKIDGFISKYPSFHKYKNEDDLSWIVREHRLLLTEILEYSIPRKLSLSSIEGELNVIMRVLLITIGTKQHPLYMKYQTLLTEMRNTIKKREGRNELNELEQARGLVPWPDWLARQKDLQNRFYAIGNKQTSQAYALNQELLLVSLYSLIPPLRNEPKTLEFTTQPNQQEGNYVLFENDDVFLDLRDVKKKHDPIKLDLPETLQKILRDSYKLYKRQYVFTDMLKWPNFTKKAALTTMTERLKKLFTNYRLGASMLRSSYITHLFDSNKRLSYNDKEELARKMRTLRKMFDLNYYKLKPDEPMPAIKIDEEVFKLVAQHARGVQTKDRPVAIPIAKPVLIVNKCTRPREDDHDTYERHLLRQSEYYKENRNEILAKQKEYMAKTKPQMNKRKVLSYLNGSKVYKARQSTLNKYGIRLVDGKYI